LSNETFISHSPEQTKNFAHRLLDGRKGRIILALHGDLGGGKTCFVQGLAAALECKRFVTSPTFTILNEYKGSRDLYHMDLYRIRDSKEAVNLGFDEYLETDGIIAVEWAERAADLFPPETIHITFTNGSSSNERVISVQFP
jgi:tRNA threonylcarbamoyladenosine biosynthesis protein TsaE